MTQDYFNSFGAMDRAYYQQLGSFGTVYHPVALHEHDGGAKTSLGPRDLGMSNNPFQHQLLALQAKIREGASSIEFQFPGRGKSSSQASTPEAYGIEEREALRQLAEYNDVKTSTHATFSISGLAGYQRGQGFNKQAQHQNMEEVRRAIDFASQASTGGAIVVHTGEWDRPMSEQNWAKKDFGTVKRKVQRDGKWVEEELPGYLAYPDEHKQAELPVVDGAGNIIGGIRKDYGAWEPVWVTAKEFAKKNKLAYTDVDGKPVAHYDDTDLVDINGRKINPANKSHLAHRVAEWDEQNNQFRAHKVEWEELQARADKYNRDHGTSYTPEEMQARIQIDNQIQQARGQSQYYSRDYRENLKQLRKYQEALAKAERLSDNMTEAEKWRMLRSVSGSRDPIADEFVPSEQVTVTDYLNQRIKDTERHLQHIHESSSSMDTQAAQLANRAKDVKSLEKYGIEQTGKALGELGIYTMEKNKQMFENVKQKGGDRHKYEDLYIAPENVFPAEYGSHPDELMNIVKEGRKQMVNQLVQIQGKSQAEAEELAKKHIKSTVDIGHLNMWKTHMVRKAGETDAQLNKRFEDWAMQKLEHMHKEGILGHFHITDNLGFNDEHLTPGQGNAPVRAFVQKLEKMGFKDFIIEPGSFNAGTIMGETWSYLGAASFKPMGHGQSFGPAFNQTHWRHAGQYSQPTYIVGAYVPSNEWAFWSGTPLE